ncbi:MAG: hypothetical protein P8X81_12480 [Woeseiaceae bacterium]|jgi:hypothetical protein
MNLLRPRTAVYGWQRRLMLLLVLYACLSIARADDARHDFLLFPSVDTLDTFNESEAEVADSFQRPSLNMLYSYNGGHFRFLGEYLWSSTESELERLKVGWRAGDNTMWWFGRFHSTAKFWTSEYHHGQFMQNSITRPSIEEWEDESGPMPSHITGVSIEHTMPGAGEAAWNYGFSIGLAPKFVRDELQAFDMLDAESNHGLSYNARMAYRPDIFGDNQAGVLIGWNDIEVDSDSAPALADLKDIRQLTIGVYGDWRFDDWRLLGNIVHFDHDMNYTTGSVSDVFVAGYLQAEYRIAEDWTVFGRADWSTGEDNSEYLRLLPEFIAHRHMLGVRWDFHRIQSLTMEVADSSVPDEGSVHRTFKEVRFQWSAVFP